MRTLLIAAVGLLASGCGAGSAGWPLANGDPHGTRSASSSELGARTVRGLHEAWRFVFPVHGRDEGIATATPVVERGTVYVQDMLSNVYALTLATGRLRWLRRFDAGTPGPNGLAVHGADIYGATDTSVFDLDAATGRVRWQRRILRTNESYVDVAPLLTHGLVVTATTGYYGGTRGAIVALEARTGAVRWRFDTIRGPLPYPAEAGGGGVWGTPTVDGDTLYAGTANPLPWGGTPARPNGGSFPGPALYTDSLLALAVGTGRLLWHDQVTPHDLRDYDFQNPPVVDGGLLIGSGKAGLVVAWDAKTHRRRWERSVGRHSHDRGPLPRRPTTVCPGLLGGVETALAVSGGSVYVPVVDLCYPEDSIGGAARSFARIDPASGTGELVALEESTGRVRWAHRVASPIFGCATSSRDVVFTSTYAGDLLALSTLDGRVLWSHRAPAGINACPAVVGDTLLVAAGARVPSVPHPEYALVAYRTGGA